MANLETELSTDIKIELVSELVAHYVEVKKRFRLGDLKPAAEAAGLFAESIMKSLLYLSDGTVVSKMGIKFENAYQKIMALSTPTDTIEEYKFRLIPQVAKDIYTIRNKKEVAHARGEKLLFVDLIHIVQSCDWLIASLLYVSHKVDEDEAIRMMIDIMQLDTPLVQEIGEYFVLTTTRLRVDEALLVILYRLGGEAKQSNIVRHLRLQYPKTTAYEAIKRLDETREIFVNPDNKMISLLPGGRARAEHLAVELQKQYIK